MLLEKYLHKQWEALPGDLKSLFQSSQIQMYAGLRRAVILSEDVIAQNGPYLSQLFATQNQTIAAKENVLQLAGSMGQYLDIPEYQALFNAARQAGLPVREMEVENQSNYGISARLDRNWYLLGQEHFLDESGVEVGISVKTLVENFENTGLVVLYLAQKQPKRVLGIFAFERDLIKGGKEIIKDLQKVGIETVLLTELKTVVAKGLIGRMGMQLAHCELAPVEKKMVACSLLDTALPTVFVHGPEEKSACPSRALCVDYDLGALLGVVTACREIMVRARKLFFWAKI